MSITQPGPAAPAVRPFPIVQIVAAVVVLAVIVLIWNLTHPGLNKHETLALRVTQAIIRNDMTPVANDFSPTTRVKLSNHLTVARLSDDLNGLGKLKGLKEDTPAASAAGYHHFQVQFEKATWVEDITYDADGKILGFHVRAPAAQP
jgi:hypothetical protein